MVDAAAEAVPLALEARAAEALDAGTRGLAPVLADDSRQDTFTRSLIGMQGSRRLTVGALCGEDGGLGGLEGGGAAEVGGEVAGEAHAALPVKAQADGLDAVGARA